MSSSSGPAQGTAGVAVLSGGLGLRRAVEGVEAGAEQGLVCRQGSIEESCRNVLGEWPFMLPVCEGPAGSRQKMAWQVDQ